MSDAPLPETLILVGVAAFHEAFDDDSPGGFPTVHEAVRHILTVCLAHRDSSGRRVVWSAAIVEPLIEAIEAALANCEAAHEAEFVRRVNAEGALHRYGGHDETCLLGQFVATYSSEPQPESAPCTCGFDAILAAVSSPDTTEGDNT